MASVSPSAKDAAAYLRRLGALTQLDPEEISMLEAAASGAMLVPARKQIVGDNDPVKQPRLLLSGWAARVRDFSDGRRQILHVLLPGDLIDLWQQRASAGPSAVVALTDARVVAAPCPLGPETGLARAYALSAEIERGYLFRQIARLGRLDAYERLADLLLEIYDRLRLAGLAESYRFPLPMTQEMLADSLGLTSVHLNRTLQLMRREGVLELRGNIVRLIEPHRLGEMVEHHDMPIRLT